MSDLILPNGDPVRTGLNVPARRPNRLATYADNAQILTKDQIAEITNDPARKWGRALWGDKWIYNQGGVGSCNACAGVRALMRKRSVSGYEFEELSCEFVYANINGGQDRGSMLDDGMEWLENEGTCLQSRVPHQTWQKHKLRPEDYAQAPRFRAALCYAVDSELELASGLALGDIGVVAVHANNDYMKLNGDGIVYSTDGPGNHAVLVDDVRIHNGELQFETANSWGLGWGQNGYGWLSWKRHFRTTVRWHQFYLIRSAWHDPEGTVMEAIAA